MLKFSGQSHSPEVVVEIMFVLVIGTCAIALCRRCIDMTVNTECATRATKQFKVAQPNIYTMNPCEHIVPALH